MDGERRAGLDLNSEVRATVERRRARVFRGRLSALGKVATWDLLTEWERRACRAPRLSGGASYKMVEDELALLDKSINEFGNRFRNSLSDNPSQMLGLRDAYKDSIKTLSEKLSLKLKEEERMVEMFLEYQNQVRKQNKLIQEKKANLLKMIAEVKCKKQELEVLTANIQDLKEEYSRKKETISTANRANEERLKRLQKSADLYKERLGLEIRKIHGDKLQFIFTNIDPKHPENPFIFSLSLNEAKEYEVLDSVPHLECLAEFQENVRKTNNFSAFLANVRKAFTATVYN